MKALQPVVDENTELIIGKMYNVRCAQIKSIFTNITIAFVPVIGEKHKDPQFGVDFFHYHIDGRFITEKGFYHVDKNGKSNQILPIEKGPFHHYISQIVIKKRKCKRLTTGIKPPDAAKSYNAWYNGMIGKSCAGKKCPHLGTKMMEENGQLVCPLHNLKGCLTNYVIIPR